MEAILANRIADHTVPLVIFWASGHGLSNCTSNCALPARVSHFTLFVVNIFAEMLDWRAEVIHLRVRQRLVAVAGEFWIVGGVRAILHKARMQPLNLIVLLINDADDRLIQSLWLGIFMIWALQVQMIVQRLYVLVIFVVAFGIGSVGKWVAETVAVAMEEAFFVSGRGIDVVVVMRTYQHSRITSDRVASDRQLFMKANISSWVGVMHVMLDGMSFMWRNVVMGINVRVMDAYVRVMGINVRVMDPNVRVVNKDAGKLMPVMVSGIVRRRFAAVGMHLFVEVRMDVLAVVVGGVVRVGLLVIMASMVMNRHVLDLVRMVVMMVRVRSAHVGRVRVMVRALRNDVVGVGPRHRKVHLLVRLVTLVVVRVILVAVRVLRGHVVMSRVLVVMRGVRVTIVVLVRPWIVAFIVFAHGLGVLAARMASLVRFFALVVRLRVDMVRFTFSTYRRFGMHFSHHVVSRHRVMD